MSVGSLTASGSASKGAAQLAGVPRLMALLYGAGLRLRECSTLRVKNVDFETHQLAVRGGKGAKDRVTPVPRSVIPELTAHLTRVRALHASDLASGAGRVVLPEALARKYPSAATDWGWQWVFPATRQYIERGTGYAVATTSTNRCCSRRSGARRWRLESPSA